MGAPVTVNIYTFGGIAFAYAIYYAPYIYLFVAAAARMWRFHILSRSQIRAAQPQQQEE